MSNSISSAKMDRTSYGVCQSLIQCMPDTFQIYSEDSPSLRELVSLGLGTIVLLRNDNESLVIKDLDQLASEGSWFIPINHILWSAEGYNGKNKSIKLDEYAINVIRHHRATVFPLTPDNVDYFNGIVPLTENGSLGTLVTGALMNLYVSNYGMKPYLEDKPGNVKCMGVYYTVVFKSNGLCKVVGYEWYISDVDFRIIDYDVFECQINDYHHEISSHSQKVLDLYLGREVPETPNIDDMEEDQEIGS